jgi:hypothetical protein
MPDEFYMGTDWQCESDPYLTRKFDLDECWPEGTAASKDDLVDGMHPFFAVGDKANRPHNQVGVVVGYNSSTDIVVMNVAPGFVAKAYVANVLTYAQGAPATYDAALAAGDPVYVDDSTDLAAGVTLSRSPANEAAALNPLAGFVYRAQDEWDDSGVGGGNSDAFPMSFEHDDALAYLEVCVMLWPDLF